MVVQQKSVANAEEVAKMDLKTLMSASYPKPRRQIYELQSVRAADEATYRLARVEEP